MAEINFAYLLIGFAAGVFAMSFVITVAIKMTDKVIVVRKNDSKIN